MIHVLADAGAAKSFGSGFGIGLVLVLAFLLLGGRRK